MGKVVEVERWTLWNQVPWSTIRIVRNQDGTFRSDIGDPEHGGGTSRGTLEQVIAGLNLTVQDKYVRLFSLENADESKIKEAGFTGYKITS
jgi:hypothetical protein